MVNPQNTLISKYSSITSNQNYPTIINSLDTTSSLISINNTSQISIKPTPLNYTSWCFQFHVVLIGYDLMGFIDGSKPCPSPPIRTINGNNLNLDYSLWIRQDQLILKCYYWVHITQTCFLYCLYLHITWSMEHSSQQLYQTVSRLTHSVEKGSSFSHKRHTVNHWLYAKCQGYHRWTSHVEPSYW